MGNITASREQLRPDPRYGSLLASKFINCLMEDGKKSVAQNVFYKAMEIVSKKITDAEPIEILLHLPLLFEDKNVPYVFVPR